MESLGRPRDGRIRIIFPESKNTQRLGSLILIASLASSTRATTSEALTRSYRNYLTKSVAVSPSDSNRLQYYLRRRNLSRKYQIANQLESAEIQDVLLSDEMLPSGTGAEKGDVRGAINLAVQLGILWNRTWQRTWRGELLSTLSPSLKDRLSGDSDVTNPFFLLPEQRMLLAWICMNSDETFLSILVPLLLGAAHPIGINALMEILPDGLDAYLGNIDRQNLGPQDLAIVEKLEDVNRGLSRVPAGRKASNVGITAQTLRRAFEHVLLWRIETLVDLGYLRKTDPLAYEYLPRASLSELGFILDDGRSTWLQSDFFHHWRSITSKDHCSRLKGPAALDALYMANKSRSNNMGYTLIEEAVLVANIRLMADGALQVLEWSDAIEALSNKTSSSFHILTSVDRQRRVSAFKVTRR